MSIPGKTVRSVSIFPLGLLLALLSLVANADSAKRNDVFEVLVDVTPSWDIESDVWINSNDSNPSVHIGDSVVFSISSSDHAYYQLFVVDSKGSTTILVPDELDSSFFPSKSFVYPPLPDGCGFPLTDVCVRGNNLIRQEGPVGRESVFMLVTNRKVPGPVFGIEKGEDAVTVAGGVDGVNKVIESFKAYVARHNIKYSTEVYSYAVNTRSTTRSLSSTFNSRVSQIKYGHESSNVKTAVGGGTGIAKIFALNPPRENRGDVVAKTTFPDNTVSARSVSTKVAEGRGKSEGIRLAQNTGESLGSMFDLKESDSNSDNTGINTTVSEPQVVVQEEVRGATVKGRQSGGLNSIFDLKNTNTGSSPRAVNSAVSQPQVIVREQPQETADAAEQGGGLKSMFDLKESKPDSGHNGVAETVPVPEVKIQEEISTAVNADDRFEDVAAEEKTRSKKKVSKVIDESEFVAEKDTRPRSRRESAFEGLDLTDIDVVAYSRKSEPMVLNDLSYEEGSAVLVEKGRATLDGIGNELLSLQVANKLSVIFIVGHTDSAGPDEDNFILSVNRAKSAKEYLVETFDIPASKIISSGKGEFSPLFPNNSRENRARNRRVEISFRGR